MLENYLVVSLVVYFFGILSGWIITTRVEEISKCDLRTIVAIAITVMWIVSIAAEIIIPAYTVSFLIHGIMGAVAGYLFSEDGIELQLGGN